MSVVAARRRGQLRELDAAASRLWVRFAPTRWVTVRLNLRTSAISSSIL